METTGKTTSTRVVREPPPTSGHAGTGTTGRASKRLHIVQAYRFCTYCGLNLEDKSSNDDLQKCPTKRNLKCHVALHHSVQLCLDQGLEHDSETDGVSANQFLRQLHVMNNVLSSLKSYNYNVVPACHFFEATKCLPLGDDSTQDMKDKVFSDFQHEAKEAFGKYRVIYLRGITVPSRYSELLPVPETNYSDVAWAGCKPPRSNTFSVQQVLSQKEKDACVEEVTLILQTIVKAYE
ncbi:hypothetical protein ONE63_011609 [Megalurothrips usitatus]|uniref:Uncharacterized protein n=1 Tax=Megalurothrips usitatus TaxID=439358 RepID=A0AAV7X1X9_9NEOP|nr:hypothetical protein ONE63_011609 [Megalurothrips usitatus]